MTVDPRVVAEDAQAYLPARPSTLQHDAGDVVLRHFPHSPQFWYGSATRPRFSDATVDQRVAEVRDWFRSVGRREFMWMVGESATPTGLRERLLELGAWLEPDDPDGNAMVLDEEPPAAPRDIEVRRVASLADYEASMRIIFQDATAEAWKATEAGLEAAWAEARDDQQMYSFLAFDHERSDRFRATCMADERPSIPGRRGHAESSPRPWRLPSTRPGTLGRRGCSWSADVAGSGWAYVVPDPHRARISDGRDAQDPRGLQRSEMIANLPP